MTTLYVYTEQDLQRFVAPRLAAAPVEYDQRFMDQYTNILRLYFNQLDAFNSQLRTTLVTPGTDGSLITFPNGAFHQDGNTTLTGNITNNGTTPIPVASTSTFEAPGTLLIGTELIGYTGKTATTFTGITRGIYGTTNVAHSSGADVTEALGVASASSSRAIPFDTTDASNQVALNPLDNTRIVIQVDGYYNIQFSAQLLNFTNQIENVTLWFKHNNNDIAYSAGIAAVPNKHGSGLGSAGATIISWNLVYPFNAGDNFQLYYASELGNVVCATYPAGTLPVHPVSPSVILTATFVSALY
jgi:hypothetical protein